MIIVTGAAGFIGSAFVWKLNQEGIKDIILVDKLRSENKWLNLRKRDFIDWIDKDDFQSCLRNTADLHLIEGIIHMGACSSTTEQDGDLLMKNNYSYSKYLWNFATEFQIPYIYASSAATYGAGEFGYHDDISPKEFQKLCPLNKYGYSKKIFDDWVLKQGKTPPKWAGLKFFNVYGPQEYHKGRMASMVYHTFKQYKEKGKVNLFKSYKKEFSDGEQLRDFIYIKDVVNLIYHILTEPFLSGIYNVGTGIARSFLDLSLATIRNATGNSDLMEKDVVEYIPMPSDLLEKYQYFTEASMQKLKKAGYSKKILTLEEGVQDYVANYLSQEDSYL
jgi:ADP-L-glycero-D-manno-heptose 6-epimerase